MSKKTPKKQPKKLDSLTSQVMSEIRKAILSLEKGNTVFISPAMVETRVMKALDPKEFAPLLVSHLSRLQIRQMCRQQLAARHEELEKNIIKQGVLSPSVFDVQLQARYPVKRDGEEVYILRSHMMEMDYRQNEARLRAEAKTKSLHADALQAECEERFPEADQSAA
jgi:hypothetical protein